MTKIALLCDSHHGIRGDSPVFLNHLDRSFKWFFDILDAENIKHVIHLGDIVDRRKFVSFVTAHSLRNSVLIPLSTRGIETHIIAGNHDQTYKNTAHVNALDELITGRYKGIHTYHNAETITIDDFQILLMPWINQENRDRSLEAINNTNAEVVMGHLELSGFEMFRGTVATHGDDRKLYDRFDMVFSGHYHHKSKIGNVQYLGAFAEFTWSDHNDPRGFHIFDTQTRELQFYENPNKMFRTITYNDKAADPKVFIENLKGLNLSLFEGVYVKVVCENRSNPYMFDILIDELYKANPADVTVLEDTTLFTETTETEIINEAESTDVILDKYIDGLTLPVSNDTMKAYLRDLYKEAMTVDQVGG